MTLGSGGWWSVRLAGVLYADEGNGRWRCGNLSFCIVGSGGSNRVWAKGLSILLLLYLSRWSSCCCRICYPKELKSREPKLMSGLLVDLSFDTLSPHLARDTSHSSFSPFPLLQLRYMALSLSHGNLVILMPAAYFVAFGPHGPRAPIHGPNHGINVFMWTAGCIGTSLVAFAVIKSFGTL